MISGSARAFSTSCLQFVILVLTVLTPVHVQMNRRCEEVAFKLRGTLTLNIYYYLMIEINVTVSDSSSLLEVGLATVALELPTSVNAGTIYNVLSFIVQL